MTPQERKVMELALEALELCNGSATVDGVVIYTDLEITAIKEALAQEKALQALHDENERLGLYKDAYAEPEEEKLHPVHIGVDVTREGTAVTAFYRKPDAVMEMFYSQFHPLTQPEKTVCPFCSSEWVTAEQHDRKMDRMEQERCVGCEACIDTACGRDECPKGWPKALQPEQEPVAVVTGVFGGRFTFEPFKSTVVFPIGARLYLQTPQRTWVGLTWSDVPNEWVGNVAFMEGAKWAETKNKEKNSA